jgi:hypothetical protein
MVRERNRCACHVEPARYWKGRGVDDPPGRDPARYADASNSPRGQCASGVHRQKHRLPWTYRTAHRSILRSLFLDFDHEQWGRLRADTPLTLDEGDLSRIRGLNESVSLDEVVAVYLPLSRLLNLHVAASQELYAATSKFLGHPQSVRVPYIIGIAGSVAVGKSTTARVLRELLARWPHQPEASS